MILVQLFFQINCQYDTGSIFSIQIFEKLKIFSMYNDNNL